MFKDKDGGKGRNSSSVKTAGGRTVSKTNKMNSIVDGMEYSETGRVMDSYNNEDKLIRAMKARRARRDEVIGVGPNPERDHGSIKIPRIEKSPDHYKLIKHALDGNILFNDCSPEQVDHIIWAMKPKKIQKDYKIIQEGDEGFNFYVVQSGTFQFSKGGEILGEAKGGDCFGELALLYYAPRAATVVATKNAEVWKLDRVTFRKILDSSNKVKEERIRYALKSAPIFKDLPDSKIEAMVEVAHYQSFYKGDVIIRKDDEGSIFYVIVAGSAQVTKAGDELNDTIFGPGDYFGERALMTNERRNANVIAVEDTDLVALDRPSFDKYLGSLLKILDENLGMRVLKSVDLLQDLTTEQFDSLYSSFMTEDYPKGRTIIKQGEQGKKFFIIKSGEVDIFKEEGNDKIYITTLKVGGHFGEMALLDKTVRSSTVIAKTDCTFFTLDRERFEKLFGPLKILKQRKDKRARELKKTSVLSLQSGISLRTEEREKIRYEDLRLLTVLGTGTFGVVKLCQHKNTQSTYALKVLQKAQIVQYNQQDNVLNEKQILRQSDHPFILKLYETFQDKNCLYMLLELVQGGELFTLLHNSPDNKLDDDQARFYAACVVDALHYLHDLSIVYRDLKPENLMIDTSGYIKVVDFGFAKKVTQKTYTLCGTPEYLAPELVLQKGHNRAVDYWAVGVLIFEMLNGSSPFADLLRGEQINICRNIVRLKYHFPKGFPRDAKDLVRALLQRYPHERIGMARNGTQDIKDHKWFAKTKFDDLKQKRVAAPWKPHVSSNLDVSNFDDFDEEQPEPMEYQGKNDDWAAKF